LAEVSLWLTLLEPTDSCSADVSKCGGDATAADASWLLNAADASLGFAVKKMDAGSCLLGKILHEQQDGTWSKQQMALRYTPDVTYSSYLHRNNPITPTTTHPILSEVTVATPLMRYWLSTNLKHFGVSLNTRVWSQKISMCALRGGVYYIASDRLGRCGRSQKLTVEKGLNDATVELVCSPWKYRCVGLFQRPMLTIGGN